MCKSTINKYIMCKISLKIFKIDRLFYSLAKKSLYTELCKIRMSNRETNMRADENQILPNSNWRIQSHSTVSLIMIGVSFTKLKV